MYTRVEILGLVWSCIQFTAISSGEEKGFFMSPEKDPECYIGLSSAYANMTTYGIAKQGYANIYWVHMYVHEQDEMGHSPRICMNQVRRLVFFASRCSFPMPMPSSGHSDLSLHRKAGPVDPIPILRITRYKANLVVLYIKKLVTRFLSTSKLQVKSVAQTP